MDIRVLVATNHSLDRSVREGRFREDLFHRLNQFTIQLPPLRQRVEDIPELARSFLEEANRLLHKKVREVAPEALEALARHDWPGNVRELRNAVIRAALLASDAIRPEHLDLGTPVSAPGSSMDLKLAVQQAVEATERRLIQAALERARGNKAAAAKLLSIDRKALYNKLERYGLPAEPA